VRGARLEFTKWRPRKVVGVSLSFLYEVIRLYAYAERVEGSVAALRASALGWRRLPTCGGPCRNPRLRILAEESVWVTVSGGSRQEHGLRQELAELTSYVN